MKNWLMALPDAPSRRPLFTLLAAGLLTLAAIVGCFRLRTSASLNAMFPRHDPAAEALSGVMARFQTVDELLVLVTLPPGNEKADPDRLIAYAARFEIAVAAGEAGNLAEAVIYRSQPDAEQFIEHQLAPTGMFYLDDAQLAAARERLSAAGMQAQLGKDEQLMSQPGPAAGALAKAMMQDPLFLHDFLAPRLAGSRPMATYGNSDALVSPDGRAILIRVLGKRPTTDLDYAAALTDAIRSATEKASPDGLLVSLAGSYPIAARSREAIRLDAVQSIIGSVVLLLVLFAVVYRQPIRMFCLAFVPVALGTLWGFGIYGWTLQELNPIAAVIGGVLAGMGIDYSVLYLTRYQTLRSGGSEARQAAEKTIREIGTAALAAFITSVAGFLAIGASSIAALRDFAVLGTLGLTGCFLAALSVLPAILVLTDNRRELVDRAFRFELNGILRFGRQWRIPLYVLGIAATFVCVCAALRGPSLIQPDSDLSTMHPRPNAPLDTQVEIGRRFGVSAGTMLVDLHAADDRQLVSLACEVQARLTTPRMKASGIAGAYGLATWLPDPAVVAARRATLSADEAERVAADFRAAVVDSPFAIAAFEGYGAFLKSLMNPAAAPDVRTLRQYRGLARDLLPRESIGGAEAVTVLFLRGSEESRVDRDRAIDAADAALRGLDGAVLTGLPVIGHDADDAVRTELPKLLLAAMALVAGYLLIHFRHVKWMILSLLPAIFGLAVLAGIARWMGVGLNMMNLVALPLLIGIDVDYGIYLVSLARGAKPPAEKYSAVASGAHAVVVCATSMIAGYASLMTTSIPAVQSLGMIVAIGVVSCLAGTIFLLCPLLFGNPMAGSNSSPRAQ